MKKIFPLVKRFYKKFGNALSQILISFWNGNLVIALSSIVPYIAFKLAGANFFSISLLLIFMTILKCGFFILYSLEKITETITAEKTFSWFLRKFTIVYLLVVLSFAVDNMLLFDFNQRNFSGITSTDFFDLSFDFSIYSFMTLTTAGFTELTAVTKISKFYSVVEVFVGLIFIAYILSGFSLFKEMAIRKTLDENNSIK